MNKVRKIKYVEKILVDKDGYKSIEYKYKSVSDNKTFRYQNTIGRLLRLSSAAHNLLYYLVDYMDTDNVVYSNGRFKERFNNLIFSSMKQEYISEGCGIEEAEIKANENKYSDASIRRAYSDLKKHNIIIPFRDDVGDIKRGVYWVNPEFFWKSTEHDRVRKIRKILQIEAGSNELIIKSKPNF